jgi:hypothetical protein
MNTTVLDLFGSPYVQFLRYYVVKFDVSDRLRTATYIIRITAS